MITALISTLLLAGGPAKAVEVPFHTTEDAMFVDATINGKPATFMFDTGFSGVIVIDPAVNIGEPTGTITLRDFVGEFQAPTVDLKSVKLGDFQVDSKGFTAIKQDQGNLTENYGVHCDGIMGLETIRKYVTQINFEKKKFVFYPDSYDISKLKPDNQKTFLLKLLPAGNNSMELEVENSAGKKFYLALDTGNAFYATTHKDKLEANGMWQSGKQPQYMRASGVASGTVESFSMFMPDMKIYGVPVKKSVWSIIDLPSSSAEHDGTVGFGFLRHFNITFDMTRRRVWLEKFGNPEDEPVAETGVLGAYYPPMKRVVVFRVLPGSPAEKAGVKAGDQILSIEGEEVGTMGYRQVMRAMEGKKGEKIKVVFSRNGNLIKTELDRDYLINGMPKS